MVTRVQTLQAGKAVGSSGYLPTCPSGSCCLAAHHDYVPDGDEGWVGSMLLLVAAGLYLGGGVAMGLVHNNSRTRKRPLAANHPHYPWLVELAGLVRDGLHFTARVWGNRGDGVRGGSSGSSKSSRGAGDPGTRGKMLPQKSSSVDAKIHKHAKNEKREKKGKHARNNEQSEQPTNATPASDSHALPHHLLQTAVGANSWPPAGFPHHCNPNNEACQNRHPTKIHLTPGKLDVVMEIDMLLGP